MTIVTLGSVLEPRVGSRSVALLAAIGVVLMGIVFAAYSIAAGDSEAALIGPGAITWTLIGALGVLALKASRSFTAWDRQVAILTVVLVIWSFGSFVAGSPQWGVLAGEIACLLAGAFFGWKVFVNADSISDGSAKC